MLWYYGVMLMPLCVGIVLVLVLVLVLEATVLETSLHTADATRLNCRVGFCQAVCTHPSAVVTQFKFPMLLRLVTSDDIMTSLLKKVINIDQNPRSQTAMFSFQIVDRIRRQSS